MAHEARGRTPGGEPGGRGEGRGRNGPAARSLREDLLWAASPRRRELRHGGQHGEAGNRRGGRAHRGRSAQAQLALRTAAPSRSAALAVSLSLACWHRPTPTPVSPVAVVPFDAYAVEIDYRQRRVRLFDPLAYRYAGTGATVPFSADADLPLLRAQLEVRGRRPIPARLLLDTGASGLCLILTTPYAERHGLGSVAPAIEAPIGTGLVGDLHGTIVRLQELRLGGVKVRSPTTGLGGEYKGFLARTDIDGVIGNSVFEGSRLIVDYVGRRAIVEPGPSDGSLCDFDMSGLRLAARGPGLAHIVVDYVIPGSPTAEAGVAVGDELLLIDGRGVAQGNLSDARKALRADGAVHRLVLRRDADTIRVALKLRRLL